MSIYYTNVDIYGNSLLVREIIDGMPNQRKLQWKPTIYLTDNSGEWDGKYKSLYGDQVKEFPLDSIKECRDFVKQYDGVNGFEIFGQLNYVLQFLNEEYSSTIDWKLAEISAWAIDIEVRSPDTGFPKVESADGEVVLITMQNINTGRCFTFGSKPYEGKNTAYTFCRDEKALLKSFVTFWHQSHVDIITGWNIDWFDLPYLTNRITRILGEEFSKKLSPWGIVNIEEKSFQGKKMISVDIKGVSILDYMSLYKKFVLQKQESYSLKHIAMVELGHTKVDLPGITFNDNIDNHWETFVEYNIVDTTLINDLDKKRKLIELVLMMGYNAKINITDVYSPVKMWDALIHNALLKDNIVVPQRKATGSSERQIEGAYVKAPKPGVYNWIAGIDALSLYPSIMMSLNISPETYRGQNTDVDIEKLLDGSCSFTRADGTSVSPIGSIFDTTYQGILPKLIVQMMKDRQETKAAMIKYSQEYELSKDASLKSKISALDIKQNAIKIALNSLYGATANNGFRFFNPDVAESITMMGQYFLRTFEKVLDDKLNAKFNTNHKYLTYSDTDSVYFSLEPIVNAYLKGKDDPTIIKSLERFVVDKINPVVNGICAEISEELGFRENMIHFKLEAVGNKAIWYAKKKYVINVHSSEGVTYAKPKFKVMGMEMVKSSTPAIIRDKLRQSLDIIFTGTEESVQKYIADVKEEFMKLPTEKIAFPRSVNGLDKYGDSKSIYSLMGTPITVRAALLYNHYLKVKNIEKKYPRINEGDKIRFVYLKLPNPIKENIIAFPADLKLPPEFELNRYIDRELQFEKVFLNAMEILIEPLNWTVEEQSTLSEFFT